jgi:predicted dehydrogenase
MIKTAMIGCGGAAWIGHLPWLWENPHVELIATCAINAEHAQKAAHRWCAPRWYTDYRDLFEKEALDAVVIATPPDTHAEISIAAAKRKIHVLLEKPMATSSQQCNDILKAVESAGVVFTLSHEKRFNPGFEEVKRLIDEGLLGRVFYLVVHWSAAVRLDPNLLCPPDYRESYLWRWTNPDVGGGILFDHLPHYIDLWRWWTGSELASIDAELLNVRRDLIGDKETSGVHEDFCAALMKFKNGCVGVFESGNAGRGLSPIQNVGSATGEWSEYGMIYGTRGHLVFDVLPWDSAELPRLMVFSLEDRHPRNRGWFQIELPDPYRAPGGPKSPQTNLNYQFKRQMDHFVDCIRKRQKPRVSGEDGMASIIAVESAYESYRQGQRVNVPESS